MSIRADIKDKYTVASVHDNVNQRIWEASLDVSARLDLSGLDLSAYRTSVDARISVQNTLYLVFGA